MMLNCILLIICIDANSNESESESEKKMQRHFFIPFRSSSRVSSSFSMNSFDTFLANPCAALAKYAHTHTIVTVLNAGLNFSLQIELGHGVHTNESVLPLAIAKMSTLIAEILFNVFFFWFHWSLKFLISNRKKKFREWYAFKGSYFLPIISASFCSPRYRILASLCEFGAGFHFEHFQNRTSDIFFSLSTQSPLDYAMHQFQIDTSFECHSRNLLKSKKKKTNKSVSCHKNASAIQCIQWTKLELVCIFMTETNMNSDGFCSSVSSIKNESNLAVSSESRHLTINDVRREIISYFPDI